MAQFLGSPEVLCLIGSVADNSGGVMGGLLIARQAADEAELLTFGVAPACRRSGLGRALLDEASKIRTSGARQLFLEVETGNEAALALYRAFGAVPVGQRPGYYSRAPTRRSSALPFQPAPEMMARP